MLKPNHHDSGAASGDGPSHDTAENRLAGSRKCIYHLDDPRGCGFARACRDYIIRNIVPATFHAGESWCEVKAILERERKGEPSEMNFVISTALVGVEGRKRVLVCIDDITERKRAESELRFYQQPWSSWRRSFSRLKKGSSGA